MILIWNFLYRQGIIFKNMLDIDTCPSMEKYRTSNATKIPNAPKAVNSLCAKTTQYFIFQTNSPMRQALPASFAKAFFSILPLLLWLPFRGHY